MWKHNGRTIRVGKGWTADNGVQNPANWHIWSASEKVTAGVVEIAEDTPPDSRFYDWSQNSDGTINSTEKVLEDVDVVDRDGVAVLDEDGNQRITKGLKSRIKLEVKSQQGSLLTQTDWAVIRKADNSTPVPLNIATHRAAIRLKATQMENAIDSATDMTAIKDLFLTWDIDGNRFGILYDWPELEE